MVAYGGAPDLRDAILHDGNNACVKGGLNDSGNVGDVDGFEVVKVFDGGGFGVARLSVVGRRRMRRHVNSDGLGG